ncbi:MAG TPA: hypothetical protein VHL80_20240 [Polyangia bacterium]|nr:hypothetical protein [Polyangia bacterium]
MRRAALALLGALALEACGKLQGVGGPAPPLVSFTATLSGDPTTLLPTGVPDVHALRVALVWGAQWLTEPFCVLPADTTVAQPPGFAGPAAVIAAGCRDPFGFVPANVAASVPLDPTGPTSISLPDLPAPDLLVGDVMARVAYASLVVFDDRDDSGTLDLAFPHRTATGRFRAGGDLMNKDVPDSPDVIYGASFVTMTEPDRRVAYREGDFLPSAFYPRMGCAPPPVAFSVLGAGGFTPQAGLAAALMNELPAEDPATCTESAPGDTTVDVAARAPAEVQEVGCDEATADGSIRYRPPPTDEPDFTGRLLACAHLPTFDTGSQPSTLIQLVVTGRPTDRCKGLTHYTLRGCREDVTCDVPDWDLTQGPPAWWPCP